MCMCVAFLSQLAAIFTLNDIKRFIFVAEM
jgi:hypothetical protein